jgi:hypothetical protein
MTNTEIFYVCLGVIAFVWVKVSLLLWLDKWILRFAIKIEYSGIQFCANYTSIIEQTPFNPLIGRLNPYPYDNLASFSTVFGKGSNSSTDISLTAFLVDNCQNIYVSGWGGATNNEGSTTGMTVTGNAYDNTTDGSDFYFIVLVLWLQI